LAEKLTGMVDAELSNVLSNGGAIVLAEFTHQVNPMNSSQRGEIGEPKLIEILLFYHFPDVTEPRPCVVGALVAAAPGGDNQQLQNDGFDDERS